MMVLSPGWTWETQTNRPRAAGGWKWCPLPARKYRVEAGADADCLPRGGYGFLACSLLYGTASREEPEMIENIDRYRRGEQRWVVICGEAPRDEFLETLLLSQACYHVRAVSELELIDTAREIEPALVILAIRRGGAVPGFAELLRAVPACRRTSILATIDQHGFLDRRGTAINDVIRKPLDPREFLDTVDRLANVPPRRAARFPVVLRPTEGTIAAGETINLSATGLLIRSSVALRVGEAVQVQASRPEGDVVFDTEVRRVAAKAPEVYGLCFRHDPVMVARAIRMFDLDGPRVGLAA